MPSISRPQPLHRLIVLTLLISKCRSLIPRECARNATLVNAICCPTPPGATEACGGSGRGFCRRVAPYIEVPMDSRNEEIRKLDDRTNWPLRFFAYLCECQGSYFGTACQDCWFGKTGKHCDKKEPVVVRRNAVRTTPRERLIFRGVLSISRRLQSDFVVPEEAENPSHDPIRSPITFRNVTVHEYFVFVHYFASRPTKSRGKCRQLFDFNHDGPGFPTWHRYFILLWERSLGRIARDYFGVKRFAVPYWDWTDKSSCDVCTDDLVGDLSSLHSTSFLRHWPIYCPKGDENRCRGCTRDIKSFTLTRDTTKLRLPTAEHVLRTLRKQVFLALDEMMPISSDAKCVSFERYFEGNCADRPIMRHNYTMHNSVHRSIRGAFFSTRTSPNDPLFLLHHTQMDRLLQTWFERRKPSVFDIPNTLSVPGHCRDCYLVGFLPLVTHAQLFTDTEAHGIGYDSRAFGRLNARGLNLTLT